MDLIGGGKFRLEGGEEAASVFGLRDDYFHESGGRVEDLSGGGGGGHGVWDWIEEVCFSFCFYVVGFFIPLEGEGENGSKDESLLERDNNGVTPFWSLATKSGTVMLNDCFVLDSFFIFSYLFLRCSLFLSYVLIL